MKTYIAKRLLLIFPTLLGILFLNFLLVQITPGGPVEQMIAKVRGDGGNALDRFAGTSGSDNMMQMDNLPDISSVTTKYRGAQGLPEDFIRDLERQYGLDKPFFEQFWIMLKNYARFDFGKSYFRDTPVFALIKDKLPVSMSLGLWSMLIIYLLSIPLGIRKALKNGTPFDVWTSFAMSIGYAIPSFLFAVFLIIIFAGGNWLAWFPLRGLTSENFETLSWGQQILDYFWHLSLPVLSIVIGGFASVTMLTKNSFVEEIRKQYVLTAQAKGLGERSVLYGHVFRNAILILISGFPALFLHLFFTSNLLVEVVFSLDGLGLLGFEAAMQRDYPVIFGTLFLFTLLSLVLHLVGDLIYTFIDPRINYQQVRR